MTSALACTPFLLAAASGLLLLRPGALASRQWAVGFSEMSCADSVGVGVWYPAKQATPARLTYRAYVASGSRGDTAAARLETGQLGKLFTSHGAADTAVGAWLDAPMLATRDAPRAGPRFPLVLIAHGNMETVPDQAPLAEYLASHGYVVASVPSPMRLTGPLTDEADMGRRAEEQARLLACARDAVEARADVRGSRYGIVGHSFGARAALLLAMRDPRVGGIVSLDGGIGTATGRAPLEAAPSFDPSASRAPILHFYERLDPFMAPDFTLLRTLKSADRWLVEAPAMHHHHFTSLGAVCVTRPSLREAMGATEATAREYAAVERATLEFLDTFLSEDAAARARFSEREWPELGKVERLRRNER